MVRCISEGRCVVLTNSGGDAGVTGPGCSASAGFKRRLIAAVAAAVAGVGGGALTATAAASSGA